MDVLVPEIAAESGPQGAAQLSRAELEALVRELVAERDDAARRRRRNVLMVGVALSLFVHLCIIVFLAFQSRQLASGGGSSEVMLEFAVLHEEALTQTPELTLQPEQTNLEVPNLMQVEDPLSSESVKSPSAEITAADAGMPALGGSGEGFGPGGIGGGAGGASFFGISSRGTRFAFIVDRSQSMIRNNKMDIAKRELARTVQGLPDFAYFHVVFFSDVLMLPESPDGWLRAKPSVVQQFTNWLDRSVVPGGGTQPGPAFHEVFALPVRPDVIFFMTDGEIVGYTADDVAALNNRGKKVIINTIAFGDPTSQDLLKQIARQSGGVYRFVQTEGW